jgi:hypothetical protein
MAYLAALTSPSDLLNRLNRILFSSRVAYAAVPRVAVGQEVKDFGGDPALAWTVIPFRGIVFYDLLSRLEQNPALRVSFVLDGHSYLDVGAAELKHHMHILHPPWFRKFFHFQQVSLQSPESCNV